MQTSRITKCNCQQINGITISVPKSRENGRISSGALTFSLAKYQRRHNHTHQFLSLQTVPLWKKVMAITKPTRINNMLTGQPERPNRK